MRSPNPAPPSAGKKANLVLMLLAGLLLLLPLPVLIESSDGALGRLALFAALVMLPAALLLLLQRRAGGPEVPEVTRRPR